MPQNTEQRTRNSARKGDEKLIVLLTYLAWLGTIQGVYGKSVVDEKFDMH